MKNLSQCMLNFLSRTARAGEIFSSAKRANHLVPKANKASERRNRDIMKWNIILSLWASNETFFYLHLNVWCRFSTFLSWRWKKQKLLGSRSWKSFYSRFFFLKNFLRLILLRSLLNVNDETNQFLNKKLVLKKTF